VVDILQALHEQGGFATSAGRRMRADFAIRLGGGRRNEKNAGWTLVEGMQGPYVSLRVRELGNARIKVRRITVVGAMSHLGEDDASGRTVDGGDTDLVTDAAALVDSDDPVVAVIFASESRRGGARSLGGRATRLRSTRWRMKASARTGDSGFERPDAGTRHVVKTLVQGEQRSPKAGPCCRPGAPDAPWRVDTG
jgi:hypothetical protein